ncbi:hypothetical protein COP2_044333 [Malus domestica]
MRLQKKNVAFRIVVVVVIWICSLFVAGISVGDDFLANEHTAPLGGWRRLRAAVGLLLSYRDLSGRSRRASLDRERLFGQC